MSTGSGDLLAAPATTSAQGWGSAPTGAGWLMSGDVIVTGGGAAAITGSGSVAASTAACIGDGLSSALRAWPDTLPPPLRSEFGRELRRDAWTFRPELGPPIDVLTGVAVVRRFEIALLLDPDQRDTLEWFHVEVLRYGALPFLGRAPWSRPDRWYLFETEPEYECVGDGWWRVRFRLVEVPA